MKTRKLVNQKTVPSSSFGYISNRIVTFVNSVLTLCETLAIKHRQANISNSIVTLAIKRLPLKSASAGTLRRIYSFGKADSFDIFFVNKVSCFFVFGGSLRPARLRSGKPLFLLVVTLAIKHRLPYICNSVFCGLGGKRKSLCVSPPARIGARSSVSACPCFFVLFLFFAPTSSLFKSKKTIKYAGCQGTARQKKITRMTSFLFRLAFVCPASPPFSFF